MNTNTMNTNRRELLKSLFCGVAVCYIPSTMFGGATISDKRRFFIKLIRCSDHKYGEYVDKYLYHDYDILKNNHYGYIFRNEFAYTIVDDISKASSFNSLDDAILFEEENHIGLFSIGADYGVITDENDKTQYAYTFPSCSMNNMFGDNVDYGKVDYHFITDAYHNEYDRFKRHSELYEGMHGKDNALLLEMDYFSKILSYRCFGGREECGLRAENISVNTTYRGAKVLMLHLVNDRPLFHLGADLYHGLDVIHRSFGGVEKIDICLQIFDTSSMIYI